MKIALLQSNYIPWKGVFDLIHAVDLFVFYEDADFTRCDWRTRNRIKTANGPQLLSVPVKHAPLGTPIRAIEIAGDHWRRKHRHAIELAYAKAPYFQQYRFLLDEIYEPAWRNLSAFNIATTRIIAGTLGCRTPFADSGDFPGGGVKDDRIIDLCRQAGADAYLSGPAAKSYIDPAKFEHAGIKLEYMRYEYPAYPQLHGDFDPFVTVLDTIFHCGERAPEYIFRQH